MPEEKIIITLPHLWNKLMSANFMPSLPPLNWQVEK